ncbi:MAG: terminase gpA endonuclease subunit [Aureliella sp.]
MLTLEESAQRDRDRLAKRSRDKYAAASEVGSIPAPEDPARRERCSQDLLAFLVEYFPNSTGLAPFGDRQIKAIRQLEHAILHHGRTLNLLPRGYCKSSISEGACIWAAVYGHRRFILFFGANDDSAKSGIESIQTELNSNELLKADFPEVCLPIEKIQGKSQRCGSQTHNGKLTHIEWTSDKIVLPMVEGSLASGVVICALGLLSASRGKRHMRPDGKRVRPDFAVIDDPQTDQSALSPPETKKRLRVIRKSILRLGGHGRQISIVMNATKIATGDLVDQLCDRMQNPGWKVIRAETVVRMPDALESHWLGKYAELLKDFDTEDVDSQERALRRATEYYAANQDEMDQGHKVTWDDVPLEPGEISAIQHALNIFIIEGEDVFDAECQNNPSRNDVAGYLQLNASVKERKNGLSKDRVPLLSQVCVFGIDVHDEILYWSRGCAMQDFSGAVVSYGTFPEQPTSYFSHSKVKKKLIDLYPEGTVDQAIEKGLVQLLKNLAGHPEEITCGLIDSGYKPESVASAIARAEVANVFSSRGIGIGPAEKPMPEYDVSPKRSRKSGPDPKKPRWYFPREIRRRVHFDANYWKDVAAARLTQEKGAGMWALYGNERVDHSLYADHLCAEQPIAMSARGRTVNVWKVVSHRDNHYWDTFVLLMVAASIAGCRLPGSLGADKVNATKKKRPRRGGVSYLE